MMKLILSLTLIWTLSSTAEALQCWFYNETDIYLQNSLPCDSDDLCATVAYQGYENGSFTQGTYGTCLPSSAFSEGKHTFSYNLAFETISLSAHFCNTDGCNSEAIPYPAVLEKNNLQCFACDDPSSAVCNKTLQCVGEQDRCISGTGINNENRAFPFVGCVSANLCEILPRLRLLLDTEFLHAPKCCGSSFCNSAWSVKLNVIPLLFGLITLIVL